MDALRDSDNGNVPLRGHTTSSLIALFLRLYDCEIPDKRHVTSSSPFAMNSGQVDVLVSFAVIETWLKVQCAGEVVKIYFRPIRLFVSRFTVLTEY